MDKISNYFNKFFNALTTLMIVLLCISVFASFQTTFFGKKYNSFFGYALFEIKTASMSGVMEIGDWILVKVTEDVELNEIITFEQDGAFVTHRVVEQYKDTYITKGDSNNAKDTPIKKEQIVGKLVKVMPKFGIVKKTMFNPKVLIILIVTILVGSTLFDKNKQKTDFSCINKNKKEKVNRKKEPEFDMLDIDENPDKRMIEQIEKVVEEHIENNNISEEELSNTMVLSKIVVNMNSKTLSSISKSLDDTLIMETVSEEPLNQEIKEKKKMVLTNKKLLLGKNEKNLIKKGIELKENEISELIRVMLGLDILEGEYKTISNKFINAYIEFKYIDQGEISSDVTLTMFKKSIETELLDFASTLVDNDNSNSYKRKVNNLTDIMLLIHKIDNPTSNVDKIIEVVKRPIFNDKKTVVKEVKKIIKQFNNNLTLFYKKLETSKFNLIVKSLPQKNLYMTNISSNIQFSKLFSDYSIDKTYNNDIIVENVRELQLKMISLDILKDMFELSYKKKYLISFNDTIFNKEKKIKSLLGNMDDIYSQGKINILLRIEELILYYDVIIELNKSGYKFSIELDISDLDEVANIRKYLYIADYIFIKNNNLSDDELFLKIPLELESKVISISKTLIEGPVIK